ncbi:MAG: hypothetical protein ACRENP_29665, partial [Longimicrobiales bacterium]
MTRAFVTAAAVGADPDGFRVASHTAGGVRPDNVAGAGPLESQVRQIRTPYQNQMHHGDADAGVALAADQRFAALLQGLVTHELHVYAG